MPLDIGTGKFAERQWTALSWVVVLGGALVLPMFLGDFYKSLAVEALTFALFGVGFNLTFGHSGIPSFGHAAFYGIGVYGMAIGLAYFDGALPLAIGITLLAAGVYGLAIGMISTRGKGIYFAILTFAFAQFLYEFVIRSGFTGGEAGLIVPVPELPLFGFSLLSTTGMYYLSLAILIGFILFSYRLLQSPLGRAMKSIRYNPERAESLGYPVRRIKVIVFGVSGVLATIAGIVSALNTQFASPSTLQYLISVDAFIIVIIGGVGTIFGPVVGGVVFVGLAEIGRIFGDIGTLIYGALLILFIIFLPDGLYGYVKERLF